MKSTFYLFVTLIAFVMIVSSAPSKQICHKVTDAHAKSVCKKFCGKAGYLLGECGNEGICVCTKKVSVHKIKKSTTKATKKKSTTKKPATKKSATKKN